MKTIRIVKDAPELQSPPVTHDGAVLGVTIAGEIVVLGYVHQEAAPTVKKQPPQRNRKAKGLAGPVLAEKEKPVAELIFALPPAAGEFKMRGNTGGDLVPPHLEEE